MEFKNLNILACKVGKNITMGYADNIDGYNYSVESDEAPHPDLRTALMAFRKDLAKAYFVLGQDEVNNFMPTGFTVTEKQGQFFLNITGKFETSYEDSINVSSGKILMEDDPTDDLVVKLNTLRVELFEYLFNGKCSQQKIEFPSDKK